jgi:hypothetical protein
VKTLTSRPDALAPAPIAPDTQTDVEQLTLQLKEQSFAAEAARAEAADLRSKLDAKHKELSAVIEQSVELKRDCEALTGERARLVAQLAEVDARLRHEKEAADAARSTLETASRAMHDAQAARAALEAELDEVKAALAASVRQQRTLQAQIQADDQSIREIMSQREGLIATRDKLEKDAARLSAQHKESLQRLSDLDQTRLTYESALVERNAEIHKLEDKLAATSVEIRTLRPRAEELTQAVKTWSHVPWRSLAAGSAAAGAAIMFCGVMAFQVFRDWTAPPATIAAKQQDPAPHVQAPAATGETSPPPKSSAKVEPDTLHLVERVTPESFEVREPNPFGTGEIPIPDETSGPASNDQVQFNPEGLPPTDPDSRPPPQDLPPMPQKPRLLLKPPAPPSAEP